MYIISGKRIAFLIISAWIIALVVAISPLFGWKDPDNNPEVKGDCLIAQSVSYTLFSTLSAFYIPAIIMLIMYIQIYKVAQAAIRKEKFKVREIKKPWRLSKMWDHEMNSKVYNNYNNDMSDQVINDSEVQHPDANGFQLKHWDTNGLKLSHSDSMENNNMNRHTESRNLNKRSFGMYLEVPGVPPVTSCSLECLNLKPTGQTTEIMIYTDSRSETNLEEIESTNEEPKFSIPHSSSFMSALRRKSTELPRSFQLFTRISRYATATELTNKYIYEENARTRISKSINDIANARRHKARIESRKQRKVAVTLAIITGVFILCWLPFFVVALVSPLSKKYFGFKFPRAVHSCVLWLGYCNSMVNPILYTIFSPDFRKAFRKIKMLLRNFKHGYSY